MPLTFRQFDAINQKAATLQVTGRRGRCQDYRQHRG